MHAPGLVHRDVKPSNVLLTLDGPRLIGIARATDGTAALTSTGVRVPAAPRARCAQRGAGQLPRQLARQPHPSTPLLCSGDSGELTLSRNPDGTLRHTSPSAAQGKPYGDLGEQ